MFPLGETWLTTPFQPEMTSSLHSEAMSSMVFAAINRHLPIETFSSAVRFWNWVFLNEALRRYGRWRMILRFWYRHFIISLDTRRNAGIVSSRSVVRIVGRSSHQRTRSASSWTTSSKGMVGEELNLSCIVVAILQKATLWIRGKSLRLWGSLGSADFER